MTVATSRRRSASVLFLGALVAMLLAVFQAPSAMAHALVDSTFPVDGAVVDEAPREVSLIFSEGVDAPTAAIKVFNDDAERVDLGDAAVDPQDETRIRAGLPAGLDDGTYVVSWRAVSADGHPIKGAWLFSVGTPSDGSDELAASVFGAGDSPVLSFASVALRAVGTGGVLLLAGAAVFGLAVGVGSDDDEAVLAIASRAGMASAAAWLLYVPVQAMAVSGLGLAALAPGPMGDVLASPVGASAVLRAVLVVAAVRLLRRAGKFTHPIAGLGLAAALALALEGHSLTQEPIAVMFVGDVVHLVSAAVWGGGIVVLAVLLRQRRRADDPVGAAQLVAGFSGLATWSLLSLVVAGSAMSWVTVRAARALTTTGYGWTLLTKLAVVAALMLIGLYNKRRLVPAVMAAAAPAGASEDVEVQAGGTPGDLTRRIGDGAWIRLRQTVRAEAGLMALVMAVTAVLVGLQPAAQQAGVTGAFTTYADLTDDIEINLVVDPNSAGLNQLHVYVLDRSGRPVEAEEVLFVLENPGAELGPLERRPDVSGPGHWSLTGRELVIGGDWELTVVVRTSRFQEDRVTIPFVVND